MTHYASADRIELARLRGDTLYHRRARYGMRGLGVLLTAAQVTDLEQRNNALVDQLAKKVDDARDLRARSFVGAQEAAALGEWSGRASSALTTYYQAVPSSYTHTMNGGVDSVEVPVAMRDFDMVVAELMRQWTAAGFDEIQHRATVRTAATGVAVVALVGAGLWYVKTRRR